MLRLRDIESLILGLKYLYLILDKTLIMVISKVVDLLLVKRFTFCCWGYKFR
jgi:hypothetical protein